MTNHATTTRLPPALEAYPDLARLVEHCRGLAGIHDLPHRKEFRASQVRWMFNYLYLVDVVDGGADYRCRLWGEFWETVFAVNLLGKCLSDLEQNGHITHLRSAYNAIVANGQMQFRVGRILWPNASVGFARVIIPFCGDDGKVSMLLSGASCEKPLDDLLFFKGQGVPSFAFEDR